jgi:hypothetical protein
MKNKKLTYFVLFPAVIIIWGIIIYKITNKDDDFKGNNVYSNTRKKEKTEIKNEVYELINDYSDPFFHELSQTTKAESSDTPEAVKPRIEKKWPAIRFDGYIVNGNKIKCHLTINSEDKILQVHEKIMDDYIVSAITPDSVEINCLGNSRWFKK